MTKTDDQAHLEESKKEKVKRGRVLNLRKLYFLCTINMFLFSQCTNEENSKMSRKPPLNPSATLPASTEDDSFGSRKARSSFGKGFFKIRGGKKATSSPNLGMSTKSVINCPVTCFTRQTGEILTTVKEFPGDFFLPPWTRILFS